MRIHVVGIGGAGMSAIARLLIAAGHEVSGSDEGHWPLGDALIELGARIAPRFGAQHVEGAQIVLRSSAYGEENVEIAAARAAGTLVWRRHEAWAHLARGKRVVAIAGTHGKTTTAAMTHFALQGAGIDASLICGAAVRGLETNAHAGASDVLVIEADEYDRTFLALSPEVAVVTNVEHDHVDQFPSLADVEAAFALFAAGSQTLVTCADDPGAAALVGAGRTIGYGVLATGAGVRIEDVRVDGSTRSSCTLAIGAARIPLAVAAPGLHNLRNATAAIAAARALGVDPALAAAGLANFRGTARRLEVLGEASGVRVVDDYAHHPTEIRATLAALRSPDLTGRLIALFQPHTPSRLAAFAAEFALALREADLALVARTYPSAREADDGGAGARDLASRAGATYAGDPRQAADALRGLARAGDVVVVMGAGDIREAGERLLALLAGGTP